MVLIEGPVEFRMGSPPTELGHYPFELPHQRQIPRRFAIAAQEVTIKQFQWFLKENPRYGHRPQSILNNIAPSRTAR